MPLVILKWKNWLEKVRRICAEFTKMVHRICHKLGVQNFHFHRCRILTTLFVGIPSKLSPKRDYISVTSDLDIRPLELKLTTTRSVSDSIYL